MARTISGVVIALVLAVFPTGALPKSVLIDYEDISPSTLEDFESSAGGAFVSPATFRGFTFTADLPRIADIDTLCRAPGRCLTADDLLLDGVRTFSDFRPGTKAFGARLNFVFAEQFPTIEVTVAGRHATRIYSGFATSELWSTLAFQDVRGIDKVSFRITSDLEGALGPFRTNYSFDDVVTSVRPVAPVPLPAAAWLLCGALGGLAVMRRVAGRGRTRALQKRHADDT